MTEGLKKRGEKMGACGHAGGKDGHNNTLFQVDITPLNVKKSLTCERMRKITGEATKEYKTCEQ